jgi:hypothetical protein
VARENRPKARKETVSLLLTIFAIQQSGEQIERKLVGSVRWVLENGGYGCPKSGYEFKIDNLPYSEQLDSDLQELIDLVLVTTETVLKISRSFSEWVKLNEGQIVNAKDLLNQASEVYLSVTPEGEQWLIGWSNGEGYDPQDFEESVKELTAKIKRIGELTDAHLFDVVDRITHPPQRQKDRAPALAKT